jgi:hypothetical protein
MKLDYKDKLSEEDIKTIDDAVKEAKGKVELSEKEELEKAAKELGDKIMPIGSKMYQQASQSGNTESSGASTKKDKDEPIEGEVVNDKKE